MGQISYDRHQKYVYFSNPFIEHLQGINFHSSPVHFLTTSSSSLRSRMPSKHCATSSSSAISFDSTVAHGLGFADSLAGDFKGCALVSCDALAIGAKVRLNLLPHLLFRVQLFVRFPCNREVRFNQISIRSSSVLCSFITLQKDSFMYPGPYLGTLCPSGQFERHPLHVSCEQLDFQWCSFRFSPFFSAIIQNILSKLLCIKSCIQGK